MSNDPEKKIAQDEAAEAARLDSEEWERDVQEYVDEHGDVPPDHPLRVAGDIAHALDERYVEPWKLTRDEFESWRDHFVNTLDSLFPIPPKPELQIANDEELKEEEKRSKLILAVIEHYDESLTPEFREYLQNLVERRTVVDQVHAANDELLAKYNDGKASNSRKRHVYIVMTYPHLINTDYIRIFPNAIRASTASVEPNFIILRFLEEDFHRQEVVLARNQAKGSYLRTEVPAAVQADYPDLFPPPAPEPQPQSESESDLIPEPPAYVNKVISVGGNSIIIDQNPFRVELTMTQLGFAVNGSYVPEKIINMDLYRHTLDELIEALTQARAAIR